MPRTKGYKAGQTFKRIKNLKVLLDTNVLMLADQVQKKPRELITDFCLNNSICICDTVYFETLRNMNHKKFQKRRLEINKLTNNIISECNQRVSVWFEILSLLYLSLLKDNPTAFFNRNINDLWIIAAALSQGVDYILTRDNHSDFHPELFTSDNYSLGNRVNIHLKKFNHDKAAEIWNKLIVDKTITLKVSNGYQNDLFSRLNSSD